MPSQNIILWSLKNRSFSELLFRMGDLVGGWLIRPLGFITKRNNKKWLIGNKTGWSDNSKYFVLALAEKNSNIRPIWIAKTKKERDIVRAHSIESYEKWSLMGIYHALTGGIFIFSSSISDVNYWASGNAKKINLWHGVGLKKLGMKYSDVYNPKSLTSRIVTPFFYSQPTYFLAPSPMMARHFADCYQMQDDQILQLGYPRCDFLTSPIEKVISHIKKNEPKEMLDLVRYFEKYSKIYIYMPTFRDDQHDFISHSGIDFEQLNRLLYDKNELLILKFHPATRLIGMKFDAFSNIIQLDKSLDIYPILPFTDVLITDYSSIYYDYILMRDKDVLLFPFDYEEYIHNSRDFAFDYITFTPGTKAWNYKDLYTIIENNKPLDFKERDEIIRIFWGENYDNSTEKIINVLNNFIKN